MIKIEFNDDLSKLISAYRTIDLHKNNKKSKNELFFTIENLDKTNNNMYGYFKPTDLLNNLLDTYLIRTTLHKQVGKMNFCISNTHLLIVIKNNVARVTFTDGHYISSFYFDVCLSSIKTVFKEV